MLTTHRHDAAASCAETCTDGYLSLRPEIECPGCPACTPTECPRCEDHAYFAAGAHPGCVSCSYLEGRDDCAGCSAPLPEDTALVVEIDETERYTSKTDVCREARALWGHQNFRDESEEFSKIFPAQWGAAT